MKKLVICAGPTAVGKTSVLRHVIRKLLAKNIRVAYLKNDVQYATDAKVLAEEFDILTATEYSGEFCPDHASVTTLYDHIRWAWNGGADQAGAVVQVPKVQESRRQVVAPKKTEPAPQVATAKTECAWCGGKLITWGSGQRCETCKRNQ